MKLLKKKGWLILSACVLSVTLIVGSVLYFAVIMPKKEEQKRWEQTIQQYRQNKLQQYRLENEQYDDYAVDVAFLGDSLTDGYDLSKYYPQYVTSNRGIGGDTTFTLEERLQVSVLDLKPKVAVLLIGANNMDTMFENYESILKELKDNLPDTKVILLSLTAMGGEHWGSKNQLAAYNNVTIKLLAKKYGFTFVDLFSALYDVSIGEVYAGYTSDGGHFTDKGYSVVTAEITPVLEILLNK